MNFSRRDFLKIAAFTGPALTVAASLPLFAQPPGIAEAGTGPLSHIPVGGLIRPPGALPEKAFLATCISCGVCTNVCHVMKYDAIAIAGLSSSLSRGVSGVFPPSAKGGEGGFFNYGTPFIKDMRDFPCSLCMECPKHCPTGALKKIEKENVAMGMALIDLGLCFGWNGDVCLSCSKACPLGAKVFDFYNGEWGNQPFINDACVGCGLCVKHCPLGGSAIKVITKTQYETVKASYVSGFKKLMSMSNEDRYNIVYGQNIPNIMGRGRLVEREYR